MPQPIRRPVPGLQSARRRFSRRLRRFPFAVRPSVPCRYGRSRFMQPEKERPRWGRLSCTPRTAPWTREVPPLARGGGNAASCGAWVGDRQAQLREAGSFASRSQYIHCILHTTFAQVGGRPGRSTTWPQVLPALRRHGPIALHRRRAVPLRGFVRSTPDRFGNASSHRPPVSRHTAPHYRGAPLALNAHDPTRAQTPRHCPRCTVEIPHSGIAVRPSAGPGPPYHPTSLATSRLSSSFDRACFARRSPLRRPDRPPVPA